VSTLLKFFTTLYVDFINRLKNGSRLVRSDISERTIVSLSAVMANVSVSAFCADIWMYGSAEIASKMSRFVTYIVFFWLDMVFV